MMSVLFFSSFFFCTFFFWFSLSLLNNTFTCFLFLFLFYLFIDEVCNDFVIYFFQNIVIELMNLILQPISFLEYEGAPVTKEIKGKLGWFVNWIISRVIPSVKPHSLNLLLLLSSSVRHSLNGKSIAGKVIVPSNICDTFLLHPFITLGVNVSMTFTEWSWFIGFKKKLNGTPEI